MFSKGSKSTSTAGPAASGTSKGAAPGAGPKGGVPSIISADLKIVGNLSSSGDLQIDGSVEGDITSRGLTVGEGAVVLGVLVAESVRVYGTVQGEIRANSVMLAQTAKVEGDIAHQSISMESGASLTGQLCRLERTVGAGAGKTAGESDPGRAAAAGPGAGERRPASY
jgi:cytoskeletal protein CcmA (bactofilin family)